MDTVLTYVVALLGRLCERLPRPLALPAARLLDARWAYMLYERLGRYNTHPTAIFEPPLVTVHNALLAGQRVLHPPDPADEW